MKTTLLRKLRNRVKNLVFVVRVSNNYNKYQVIQRVQLPSGDWETSVYSKYSTFEEAKADCDALRRERIENYIDDLRTDIAIY